LPNHSYFDKFSDTLLEILSALKQNGLPSVIQSKEHSAASPKKFRDQAESGATFKSQFITEVYHV
jgi:hypothetical protein